MASFEIIADNAPYYDVKIVACGQEFVQTITSANTGEALTAQLQAYADDYEAGLPEPEIDQEPEAGEE